MKQFSPNTLIPATLITLFFLPSFTTQLQASEKKHCCEKNSLRKIGDFRIIGKAQWKSFLVNDNKVYHPTKNKYKHISKHWMVGDRIRLYAIRSSCKVFFILNLRTGQTIKAKNLTIKS